MKLDSPFARDAIRRAVVMLLIPLALLLAFSQLVGHLTGVPLTWQEFARGVAIAIFIYVIVMRQRYRRYSQ